MKKFIFDLITLPFSLFDNPIYNYIAMFIVGNIAFIVAWNIVGKSGLRGELGSILHWIIRILVFIVVWFLFAILILAYKYIVNNIIIVLSCIVILIILFIIKMYAENHPYSIWNIKIF